MPFNYINMEINFAVRYYLSGQRPLKSCRTSKT